MKFCLAIFANRTKKTVVNSAIYLHLYNYKRAHNKTFTSIFPTDLFALVYISAHCKPVIKVIRRPNHLGSKGFFNVSLLNSQRILEKNIHSKTKIKNKNEPPVKEKLFKKCHHQYPRKSVCIF